MTGERTAKQLFEWNGHLPEAVHVREVTPDGHATRLYAVVLDYGWAERICAGDCYDHDALAIAEAIKEVIR